MSRAINKLTDREVRAFLAEGESGKKLFDGAGLFLTVTKAGTGAWRVKYRLAGKERLYAIGTFPDVTLQGARVARQVARDLIRQGKDPVMLRRLDRAGAATANGHTFASLAADWLEKKRDEWSESHHDKSRQAIERDLLPRLGPLAIGEITPAMVATVIERVVKRGAHDTAGKILWNASGIFQLAQARGLCRDNPALPARAVIPRRRHIGHRFARLTWPGLSDILRRASMANLSRAVYAAHRLQAFTAARIGNVVAAEWTEFNLDATPPTWIVPRSKMKMQDRRHDYKAILGPTIAGELRAWRDATGGRGNVFASPARAGKTRTITREALEKAYRVTLNLAGEHTPDGWRAAFSTLSKDHGFERDVVEIALDHIHDNEVVRAYDRGERWQMRIKLAEWWDRSLVDAQTSQTPP